MHIWAKDHTTDWTPWGVGARPGSVQASSSIHCHPQPASIFHGFAWAMSRNRNVLMPDWPGKLQNPYLAAGDDACHYSLGQVPLLAFVLAPVVSRSYSTECQLPPLLLATPILVKIPKDGLGLGV